MSDAAPGRPRRPLLPRLIARGIAGLLLVLGVAAAIVAADVDRYFPLDLKEKPGAFTQWRIRALAGDRQACLIVLDRSDLSARPAPDRPLSKGCGYGDAVFVRDVGLSETPAMRCALAAAFAAWERHVVQPAAQTHFGARVTRIRQLGVFTCRDIARRPGRRSQHATANAIDVSGFDLSDGRGVSLLADWEGGAAKAAFLREVRDGACGLFAGVLSPDYDAAHRDHFHLDLGRFDICR